MKKLIGSLIFCVILVCGIGCATIGNSPVPISVPSTWAADLRSDVSSIISDLTKPDYIMLVVDVAKFYDDVQKEMPEIKDIKTDADNLIKDFETSTTAGKKLSDAWILLEALSRL